MINRANMVNKAILMTVAVVGAFCMGATFDPVESFKMNFNWHEPAVYPRPTLENMDVQTLSVILDSGILQWYEPRLEKNKWEGVVGLKIHTPPEVVSKVISEYERQCGLLPEVSRCKIESVNGNETSVSYRIDVSAVILTYTIDVTDVIRKDSPHHFLMRTVEGKLKTREIEILLVPIEEGTETLLFMRYFTPLRSLGTEMKLALAVLPYFEPSAMVGAAMMHAGAYRDEAEKRVGYKAPEKPAPLAIDKLDIPTMRLIDEMNGGLVIKTPEGKVIESMSYAFVDAPIEQVWEVATDFENYDDIFKGCTNDIISQDGNTLVIHQKMALFSIMFYDFGFEFDSYYIMYPRDRLFYNAFEGTYSGSHGEFRLMPVDGGKRTLLFSSAGTSFEDQDNFVSRIVRSSTFPIESLANITIAQAMQDFVRIEAEAREKKKNSRYIGKTKKQHADP